MHEVIFTSGGCRGKVSLRRAVVITELTARGRVFRTGIDDDACGLREQTVRPDGDESPGGCSSVLVRLNLAWVDVGFSPATD